MGHQTRGVKPEKNGSWTVDKRYAGERIYRRGFESAADAQAWLIARLGELRHERVHGVRRSRCFGDASAHYVEDQKDKASIETEISLLKGVMPFLEHLPLEAVHDAALAPYVAARLKAGRSHKTVNLALGVVRRILNLAARSWRDESGRTWLASAPAITMLPLVGHQREPHPISWAEQRRLLPALPDHLARMALFVLNTGVRDNVACSLRWDWEIPVPELGCSVFEVPARHVKGRKRARVVVCNAVAQSVIEAMRGRHSEFVFVYRRERMKNLNQAPVMPYKPIARMNNTAWQRARTEVGLPDLHVHDLRHTSGMRLREAGVAESTIADLLWHSGGSITAHYSMAQLAELHRAVKMIESEVHGWNKSLATLRREALEARLARETHAKVTQQLVA